MTRIMIIEEIFKLYDSGQLRGKIVKIIYNHKTHLLYDFTDFGGIKKFRRNILNTNVANNECSITGCMTDYLYTLLQAIKANSFFGQQPVSLIKVRYARLCA